MKRLHIFLLFFFAMSGVRAADIFVSPNGSDLNDGTVAHPLATISKALWKARELRRLNDPSISKGIHIILRGGIYSVKETIHIRTEDSGTPNSPTYIEAAPGELPVLSGGVSIGSWKKQTGSLTGLPALARGKVWVAEIPGVNRDDFNFRQLWVNNIKAIRAKSANGDTMHRILNWNKKDESCLIPNLPSLKGLKNAEMFIHQWWAIAILRIRKIEVKGDSARLYFYQPESKIQNGHPWPAPWLSKETGNSAFYLTNAIQFLDEPGEWWLDQKNNKLYYWPRTGEDLSTAKVIAPSVETLLKIEGTIDNPVSHFYIKGVSFQHTGWLRPSQQGHVPHQAGMFMTEAYKLRPAGTKEKPGLDNQAWIGRPAAAVEVKYANETRFENCRFEHLASTAIDYHKGVKNNSIIGNLFKEIGGTAILAGVFSEEGQEIHLPYHPKDEREISDSLSVSNNFITDVANEDWSCVGIGMGYTRNSSIENNELENLSYSGISMGWGWTSAANVMKNNRIARNKIHHYGKHNYDCAGIYTLSAQPGSFIINNYIDSIYKATYAHLPSHWFYLYTDEGSSFITVRDNWTPSLKFLQNANGPGNVWSNNGPDAGISIKANAGLQSSYQFLLTEKTTGQLKLAINEQHDELMEMVFKPGATIDVSQLKKILQQSNIDSNSLYQWQNHYVIFGKIQDVSVLQGRLRNNFPDAEVKPYHDMFYSFSKRNNCSDTITAREWDHVILTANLVEDARKQQEYLDYHFTQFEKWPELSKGFCNASFQQLLIFRNGRQLMLVISIPKGESLDRLNPKTTENNPRVADWNKLMSKYQEGIAGTKKGETWVFLKKVN